LECGDASSIRTATMLNFPTIRGPKRYFETLLKSIEKLNPSTAKKDIGPHLAKFLSEPAIKNILGETKDPGHAQGNPSSHAEVKDIHNTLDSLSKAINDIQKKITPHSSKQAPLQQQKAVKGKANANAPRKTYSAIASTRPPNPSLVVDLANLGLDADARPRPEVICEVINKRIGEESSVPIQLAGVRWTAKGNLIVTGGPTVTPHALLASAPYISKILAKSFQLPASTPLPAARANTKWSKITINGVPTGASDKRGVYTPDECQAALAAINPSYATLLVMQKPSWVRPPTSYSSGAVSSLSVAFEDTDGSILRMLLTERYLYAFGNRATVKMWNYRQTNRRDNSDNTTAKHTEGGDRTDEENVESVLTPLTPRPRQQQQPANESSPFTTFSAPAQDELSPSGSDSRQ
jgi:hypothetical protein